MIVSDAPVADWPRYYDHAIVVHLSQVLVASEDNGETVAVVAIAADDHDQRWAFLDVVQSNIARRDAIGLVRAMSEALHFTNRQIFTICNINHERAPKLLALLGFAPTQDNRNGFPVWVWQPWPL